MQSWPAPDVPALPGRGPQLRLYDSADRQVRPVTAGETAWKRSVGSPLGRSWVRVVRQGDRLVALRSLDRLSWTQIGSVTAAMSRTAVMGLVVASRSADTPIQATFGDLNVIP